MRTMRKVLSMTVVALAVVLMLTPVAHAITIQDATLSAGTVTVHGNKAEKAAPISWEGTPVATSTNGGAFSFTNGRVPWDCIGTLIDGVSTVAVAIAGCTPPPAALTATGQTTPYATGDDGDIKAGAALSYTDNGDGTITDNNTGLMWEKKSADGTIHDKDAFYLWANAFAVHIAGLNDVAGGGTACFAGYCDWRLPNVKELQSIVNYGAFNPAVSAAFNTGCVAGSTVLTGSCTAASSYWASSSFVSNPALAWSVVFSSGNVGTGGKGNTFRVRAVRGGL